MGGIYQQIGQVIGYMRCRSGVSQRELCRGICSRTGLAQIENGVKGCEKIVCDALLQRAGVSADKFSCLMDWREERIFALRQELRGAVESGQREQAGPLLERYGKLTEKRSPLHRQYLCLCRAMVSFFGQGEPGEILEELERGLAVTAGDTGSCAGPGAAGEIPGGGNLSSGGEDDERSAYMGREGRRLSLTEYALEMMRCRIFEKIGDTSRAAAGYEALLAYGERCQDEEDRVKFWPQIAWRLCEIYRAQGKGRERAALAERVLRLLCHRKRVTYLGPVLEVLAGEEGYRERQGEFEETSRLLKGLYESYGIPEEPWNWEEGLGRLEPVFCGDVIRCRRLALGQSQEELCGEICQQATLSRIESGRSYPRRSTLRSLLARLGREGDYFESAIPLLYPQLMDRMVELELLISNCQYREALPLLEELEKKGDGGNTQLRQYLSFRRAGLNYWLGREKADRYIERLEAALRITVPGLGDEVLSQWDLGRQEINCVSSLALACAREGRLKRAVELMQSLRRNLEGRRFGVSCYPEYALVMRSLGSYLGSLGQLEEAVGASDAAIRASLGAGLGTMLRLSLYDMGWNREQLWSTGRYTSQDSLPYVRLSYGLERLMGAPALQEHLREHLERVYGDVFGTEKEKR